MLAQQLGDLGAAEHHYEQQLGLVVPATEPDDNSADHAAAYTDVMKVLCLHAFEHASPVARALHHVAQLS